MKHLSKELEQLQNDISQVELLTRPPSPSGFPEFLVMKIEAVQIRMEGDKKHLNPHVHINVGKDTHVASYSIMPCKRLAGHSTKYEKVVTDWIEQHSSKLLELWKIVQAGKDVKSYVESLNGPS